MESYSLWPFQIVFSLSKVPLRSIQLIACLNNLFLCWVELRFLSMYGVFTYLSVLNQGVGRATPPPNTLRDSLLTSSSSWRLLALPGCDHTNPACASVLTRPFSLCVSPLCFMRTPVIGFRVHQGNPGWSHLKISSVIHLQRSFFHRSLHWPDLRNVFLWGPSFNIQK